MKIERALAGVTKLGIDTAPIIYLVNGEPEYQRTLRSLFSTVDKKRISLVTSTVTLAEVLIHPKKEADAGMEARYKAYLLENAAVDIIATDAAIAEQSAQLRAHYNLRLADAFQIAACLSAGCEAFLTNDDALRRVGDIRVLVLKELAS